MNTQELLEHIISPLSMEDILAKAQRVSRGSKATIASSTTIQTKLWVRVQSLQILLPKSLSNGHDLSFPLPNGFYVRDAKPVYGSSVKINPLCTRESQASVVFPLVLRNKATWQFNSNGFTPIAGHHKRGYVRKRFKRDQTSAALRQILAEEPQASWHTMLLTEPPIRTTEVAVPLTLGAQAFERVEAEALIEDPTGITLRRVKDEVDQILVERHIKNCRPDDRKRYKISTGKEFMTGWGKRDDPLFLVQSDPWNAEKAGPQSRLAGWRSCHRG